MSSTTPAFSPSPQQSAVFAFVQDDGRKNAFVEAVAGSGKTTALIKAVALMSGTVAFAAYNKKIATEIEQKLEPLGLGNRVKAGTFHRFGLAAWKAAHPKVLVDADLKKDLMLAALNAVGAEKLDLTHLRNAIATERPLRGELDAVITKLVSLAKQGGAGLYWQIADRSKWFEIVDHHDLTADMEQPDDIDRAVTLAIEALQWSRTVAGELIDFDDMIWLPIITDVRVWQHDWVLVDESQDTNPARRALARRMLKKTGRILFVGDRHQAIYGFTGADNDSVDQIIRDFNCELLPLTITYRCPQSVVAEAQKYVSHIQAAETAPLGEVMTLSREGWDNLAAGRAHLLNDTKPLAVGDAILCRNTKPLVSLAFNLIKQGIACQVEGRDIGQGLIKLAQRWKVRSTTELHTRLEAYREREVEKLNAKGRETTAEALNDRVDTLLILMDGCPDIKCVVDKITRMFQDTEGKPAKTVLLSTVHKAKGREWRRVFILGRDRYMPSKWARQEWQLEQENNLIYVAVTRAQDHLVFVPALEDEKPAVRR